MRVIEAKLDARGRKFGIIVSRFNNFVTDKLLEGAMDALKRHGAEEKNIDVVRVPGAFEIPLLAYRMAGSGKYDGLICLGAVIRGGTPHFDYIAGEVTRGLGRAMLDHQVPIAFGVLTTNTPEQALERAGTENENKGFEAALTAIEMVSLGKIFSC
ncbi:MAG TPA: 6,7-dimethyl-8-ribityllumazine synthase [Candidatus Binatia bacterium]